MLLTYHDFHNILWVSRTIVAVQHEFIQQVSEGEFLASTKQFTLLNGNIRRCLLVHRPCGKESESVLSNFHLITSIHSLKALTTTPFMKKAWKSFLIYNIPWEGDCWIVIIRSSGSVSVSDIKRDWFRMTMVWPCSSMTCSPKITGDSSFTGWSSGKTNYDDGETCRI